MDDISALREVTGEVLQADAWLFKPADAVNFIQGDDNGTPFQRDEPQAQNPLDGAVLDYYLKAPAAVTLEVLDAAGQVLRKWPADRAAGTAPRGGLPRVSPLWQPVSEVFATTAGMHRVVWQPVAPAEQPRRGGGARLIGRFAARLTVNGRALTQTFSVRPDPRVAADSQ